MRTTSHANDSRPPVVEERLDAAHRRFEALRDRCAALVRSGFSRDDLPSETALMCFALLGDHEREQVVGLVAGPWPTLQAKGLIQGTVEAVSTGELRLLAHILPFVHIIDDLWDRLQQAARHAGAAPPDALHCPDRVHGQWGQTARVHFSARAAAHLLIVPDAVFGVQPALVAVPNGGSPCVGSFSVPIDDGTITIAGLLTGGEAFRHLIQVTVERVA